MGRKRVPLKNHQQEMRLFTRRAQVCAVLALASLIALVLNLYSIQITQHQEYQTRSNKNRITVLPISPNRGRIFDRNGELLATNTPVYQLELIPEEIEDLENTLQSLTDLLQLSDTDVQQFKRNNIPRRRFPQVVLANNLTEEQVALFTVHQHKYPFVSIEAHLQRYYPHHELFTHAIGYIGHINSHDIENLKENEQMANYAATNIIGKLGVERFYEQLLHGTVGHQTVEINSRGRVIRTLDLVPPVPGYDLYLELDLDLQRLAHMQLLGRRGAIVVLDAKTGGVLALASGPSYDPNWFVGGISSNQYKELLENSNNPLINRATQGRYPPASTVKPAMGLLGLSENIITADTRVWDPGWYQIKGVERRFRDWRRGGHGWVTLDTAIVESCNTFYYDLAYKLGIDRISNFMSELGFGQKTGIDIHEENSALMPSREWKKKRLNESWYIGETISVGIGQSYWTTTPIQMASITQTIAKKGQRFTPKLLRATRRDKETYPYPSKTRSLFMLSDDKHWDSIHQAMHHSVSQIRGTSHNAFKGARYTVAAKTGTAQVTEMTINKEDKPIPIEETKEHLRDNATFIAFAPVEDPEIIIAIAMENVGGGGKNAAPIARLLLDTYFSQKRVDGQPQSIISLEQQQLPTQSKSLEGLTYADD